jgi:diaminopimelate decarboxylase
LVDLEDVCRKHINWITKVPRIVPYYAMKCNPDPMVLRLLAYLGAGFDCASQQEIATVVELGVSPDRIIFANPCKQTSFVKFAYKKGVNYMTFDNEYELYKMKENHPSAKCVLRIVTNDANATLRLSNKFGANMEMSYELIDIAHSIGLDVAGISFHVGCNQLSPETFSESIRNARILFDYAREKHGIRMHLLDIGGGYPGAADKYSGDLFDILSDEINRSMICFTCSWLWGFKFIPWS